jgi:hypothetical protein
MQIRVAAVPCCGVITLSDVPIRGVSLIIPEFPRIQASGDGQVQPRMQGRGGRYQPLKCIGDRFLTLGDIAAYHEVVYLFQYIVEDKSS